MKAVLFAKDFSDFQRKERQEKLKNFNPKENVQKMINFIFKQ